MKVPLSTNLQPIPILDNSVVLSIRKLHIPGVFAPYNGSITEGQDGYYLVFRYDFLPSVFSPRVFGNIGLISLDENFNPIKPFIKVETGSKFSEDPRILAFGSEFYLVYNDLISAAKDDRVIHLAQLNPKSGKILSNIEINPNLKKIEKNWVPFVYKSENGAMSFNFEYQICNPRKIIHLKAPDNPNIATASSLDFEAGDLPWDNMAWGMPLGGTPARLVDGEYLAFFHSKYTDSNFLYWYVAGAYTFEATPPFRVTAMSSAPILFENIYDSPLLNTGETYKQVIFPAGFAIEKKDGKTLIHLSCGENDSSIKIVTLDKEAFMKTLVKIPK